MKRKLWPIAAGVTLLLAGGAAAFLTLNDSPPEVQGLSLERAESETASAEDQDTVTGSAASDQTQTDADSAAPAPDEIDSPLEPESAAPEVLASIDSVSGWQPVFRCVNGLEIESDGQSWRIPELGLPAQPLEGGEVPRQAMVELCGDVPGDEDLEVLAQAEDSLAYQLTTLDPITFSPGTSTLAEGSDAVLDEVVKLLASEPEARIEVAGHTDSRGSAQANKATSQTRAEIVVAELKGRGVENELVAVGQGEELRTIQEDDGEALAQNRRIELRVLD